MTARHFEGMRFSKHFILLDFLYDRDMYTFNQPLTIDDIWDGQHEEAAITLCNQLLEPCISVYGACSVAGGFWPAVVQTPGGHYHTTPHFWDRRHGAGADCVWHEWVNAEKAPINMVFDLEQNQVASFDRMISYAGSEFLCMATKGGTRQRAAVHENRRLGPNRKKYKSFSPRERFSAYKGGDLLVPDHDWRRGTSEPVHSTGNQVRAHHIRTGEYFVMLDFARNAQAIQDGVNTVPSVSDTSSISACRMFSEVMDPMVRELGRVSVVRGTEPASYGDDDRHHWSHQVSNDSEMVVRFVLPVDTDEDQAMDILLEHHAVTFVEARDHVSKSVEIELGILPFEIEKTWASSKKYG